MVITQLTKEQIWNWLAEILDPEVPVLNIVELGIVRDVLIEEKKIIILITPTYSGCPAMKVIEDNISQKLKEKGINDLKIQTVLSPAWTTDWMSTEAKEKLRQYGIAPPIKTRDNNNDTMFAKIKNIVCPNCGSRNTVMKSRFGSTACKALYFCNDCLEPFDYFKCI